MKDENSNADVYHLCRSIPNGKGYPICLLNCWYIDRKNRLNQNKLICKEGPYSNTNVGLIELLYVRGENKNETNCTMYGTDSHHWSVKLSSTSISIRRCTAGPMSAVNWPQVEDILDRLRCHHRADIERLANKHCTRRE